MDRLSPTLEENGNGFGRSNINDSGEPEDEEDGDIGEADEVVEEEMEEVEEEEETEARMGEAAEMEEEEEEEEEEGEEEEEEEERGEVESEEMGDDETQRVSSPKRMLVSTLENNNNNNNSDSNNNNNIKNNNNNNNKNGNGIKMRFTTQSHDRNLMRSNKAETLLSLPDPHKLYLKQPLLQQQQRQHQLLSAKYHKSQEMIDFSNSKRPGGKSSGRVTAPGGTIARGVGRGSGANASGGGMGCGRGRGITLNMLMKDGVIESGGGCLSLEYLGKKFAADLLPNGKIRWQENNEIFNSPSAWASHCKKLVNPSKKSGCGWASIKYKGRKLVSWKSLWCRKQRQNGNVCDNLVPLLDDSSNIMKTNRNSKDLFHKVPEFNLERRATLKPPLPAHIGHKPITNGKTKKHVDWSHSDIQEEALNLSLKGIKEESRKIQKLSPPPPPQQCHQPQQQKLQLSPPPQLQQLQPKLQQQPHSQQPHRQKVQLSPPPPPPTTLQQQQQQQQHHHNQKTQHQKVQLSPPLPQQTQQQQKQHQHHSYHQTHQQKKVPPSPKHSHQTPKLEKAEIINTSHPRFPLVKHSNLLDRNAEQDPNTLVECETFEAYGKFQPFSVSVTTNSMFLIDFHCHLTSSEVLGYLAGKWDQNTQHLNILQAFPCLSRLGDKENAPLIEAEIRHRMNKSGLSLVGWYHSHPHRSASPTLRDIDCQMTYQLKMKGVGSVYHPCLGFIIAPYNKSSKKKESTFRAFWVMPPLVEQPLDYGIPMEIQFSIYQNPSLTEELLSEMKALVDFYKGSPDVVRFSSIWHQSVTYLDKVKWSLLTKLPQDQDENSSTLEFVRSLLLGLRV